MSELKNWDSISMYGKDFELYKRKSKIIEDYVLDFYTRHNELENMLSSEEVYKLCDTFTYPYKTNWYNKIALRKDLRKDLPVIFGIKSGIVFKHNCIHFLNGSEPYEYWDIEIDFIIQYLKIDGNKIYDFRYPQQTKYAAKEDINLLIEFLNGLVELKNKFNTELAIEQEHFSLNKNIEISKFDLNGDGQIDLVENEFHKLINKNQKLIISLDKNYIHKFVKISNYIKTKQQNTQTIFQTIRDTESHGELEVRIGLLKNQIHAYELMVFHAINMVGALVSEDLITFYEIYEVFDKLGIFNSNWENEVSEKLKTIGDKIDDLMYAIQNLEESMVSQLNQLSYFTHESYSNLNSSVMNQLREVESSINFNNLLTGIQTYQLYKINKNTKGLRL
jgi:hypothetical protein